MENYLSTSPEVKNVFSSRCDEQIKFLRIVELVLVLDVDIFICLAF